VLVERVRRIIELDRLQNFLSSEVAVQTKRSVHLSKQIMLALSKAVDAKDHYTNGHSRRVAAYSAEIARRMGKSAREQEDIYAMGLLHDVGKIGISEAIINKTSRLDDDEYAQIKNHTTIGYDILKLITEIPGLATGARWHHERYDGRGYPDGLSGTDIPEEARIICVADCYDAMTSNRSYSVVRDQSAVRAEILRCRGSQFDPDISDIMIAMIDDDPDYLMSERDGHDAEIPTAPREYASPGADDADDTEENPETEEESIIPTVEGLDLTYARRNFPDDIMLASTLKNFTELMPSKLEKLAFAYESADNGAGSDSYRIIVHSMKSSSAMVGLIALSELARTLEFMAKDGDIGGIRKLHGKFADDWKCMYERLSEAYEAAKKADRRDTGDGFAVLPELLAMLRLNMENMDIDAADGVMKLICSYSYSPVVTELTEQLKNAVLELDEGAAGNISDMILKELKQ
jgi:HPt (histidine-containing phosphotransfer) domain-containing protein